MKFNKVFKTQKERFFLTGSIVDCKHSEDEVVSLSSSSVAATDCEGTDVSTTLLDQATMAVIDHKSRDDGKDCCLTIRCRNGEPSKSPFAIVFTITTNLGNVFEIETTLIVSK